MNEVFNNRWFMLSLLFLTRLSMGFQFQSLGSVGPAVISRAGLSNFELGSLIGIFMLPGLFLAFPGGYLGRYFSDKSIISFGLMCLCGGGLISIAFSSFGIMAIGRIVCGIGFVLTTMYFSKVTIDWFEGRELATAMGILIISWPGGIALSQAIHPLVSLELGWRGAISTASIFCFGSAIAIYVFYKSPETHQFQSKSINQESNLSLEEWLRTILAALSWAFYNAGYLVFLSFAFLALTEIRVSTLKAATVLSFCSFLIMLSIPLGGFLADKFSLHKVIVFVSSLIAIVSLLLLPLGNFWTTLCILFGALGMSAGGIIIALAGKAMSANRRAFGMGVFQTIYFFFAAGSPVMAGWLYDYAGSSNLALAFAASLFFLAWLSYFFFIKATKKTKSTLQV